MKKIKFLVFIFPMWLFAQSGTLPTNSFGLQQAIAYALEHNYNNINAGRDIAISKQKKWETTAMGLPQINAAIDYQNNIVLQKSLLPAEIFGGPAGTFAEVAFGTKQNMAARGSLSQLIFDGSYIVALQASKAYLQFFENAKKKTNGEIKELITNSYGNILLAEESINILEKNKVVLEKNLNDAEQIFKNGLGEQEAAEQIAITLSSVKISLERVKRLREISLNMLKIQMGLKISDTLKLTDSLENLSVTSSLSATTAAKFSVTNNIDYQIANSMVTQKRLLLKLEKAKALPSLAAIVNLGANAFSQSFTFMNSSQRWFNYSNVGVSLNIPIFSSFARSARTQQAKLEFEKAQTQLTEAEQMLQLQFQKAKSDLEFNLAEYTTTKNSLDLAERIERKQQIKFKEGLSTSFEFSEAQRQLYAEQQKHLQSMVNIITSRAALEKLTTQQ